MFFFNYYYNTYNLEKENRVGPFISLQPFIILNSMFRS